MRFLTLLFCIGLLVPIKQTLGQSSYFDHLSIQTGEKYFTYTVTVSKEVNQRLKTDFQLNFSGKEGIRTISIPNTKTLIVVANKNIKLEDILSLFEGCEIYINDKEIKYEQTEHLNKH